MSGPLDRFTTEQSHLVPTAHQRSFAHEGRRSRIVASDYLVSYQTNRYSVPFRFIGHTVELQLRDGILFIHHRDRLIAEHPLLTGQHQLRILPEHGPGAIARNARQRFASADVTSIPPYHSEVQIRDLSVYDQLTAAAVAEVNHERRTA